jgi:glyoxylase-like metal-dependent hydrolase (beta-lactamase superfamily II)
MNRPLLLGVLTIVACLSIATNAAAQPAPPPADPLVKESTTIKVADHTYVIPDGNVGLVPNVGIIVGSRATLVIDPGLGKRNGETVRREAVKVSNSTEFFLASTHYHAEHTTGIAAFPASAKYVNSTVQDDEQASSGAALIKTFSGRSPLTAELLKDATVRKADVSFDRDYVLDLGGVHVRFLVVGPTHTAGDTAFLVEEDGVLFSGDVVMNNSFLAATPVSSMKAWLAAFDVFEAMKPRTIVPSHGAVGGGSLIGLNRSVMLEVQARARALKKQGRSADETATTIQAEMQKKYPQWARANGVAAAARSAYAEAP